MSESLENLHRPSVPVCLNLGGLEVQGFSISGLATWFLVPQWRLCFDMGDCPIEAVRMNHVFLTHAHGDHARLLLRHHSLRGMLNMKPAEYFVPHELVAGVKGLTYAWADLEGYTRDPDFIPGLKGIASGGEVELNPQLSVTAFAVDHTVLSLGYTVWERRKKLLPELVGLPGAEIAARKSAGLPTQCEQRIALLTFIGDSRLVTLEKESHVLRSRILVVESTFLMDEDRDMAEPKGHIHLAELFEFLSARKDDCGFEHLVLKHFSMKYSRQQIETRCAELVPDFLRERVRLLI